MDKKYIIGINDARVLRSLWIQKSMSRIELSRYLGLDKSTISKIVGNLLESGIIELVYEGDSSPNGGRKPTFLSINPNFGAVLGVEMQTDFYIALLVDFSGKILFKTEQPLSMENRSVADAFLAIYESLAPQLAATGVPVIGAAIGASGIINPYDGIIFRSNPLSSTEAQNVYQTLDTALDIPVMIDNDANCGAWGEIAFKKDDIDQSDFIYILGETRKNTVQDPRYKGIAIGTSIAIDQKVHNGKQFSSGEFQSVFRTGEHLNQFSVTDREAEIYENDDTIFSLIAHELSKNVAFVVNMLNLQQVVLGGRMEYHPEIISIMREEIVKNWAYSTPVDVTVRFSSLQELTIAYGAAGMFLESLFSLPDVANSKKPIDTYKMRSRATRATPFSIDNL